MKSLKVLAALLSTTMVFGVAASAIGFGGGGIEGPTMEEEEGSFGAAAVYAGESIVFYDTLDEALAAAPSGSTVMLYEDVDYWEEGYTERNARDYDRGHAVDLKDITLDLNEHTIKTVNASVVFCGNGATIKNGTFDLVEKNTDGSYKDGSYALIIDNSEAGYATTASVALEDVVLDGGLNVANSTVTVDNVTAHTTTTKFYAIWAEQNANLTINSGEFTDSISKGKGVFATGKGEDGGAVIRVNGGTFNASNKLVYSAEDGSLQFAGGTYTKDPTAYVADGYVVTGAYEVVKANMSNLLTEGTFKSPVDEEGFYEQMTADVVTPVSAEFSVTYNVTSALLGTKAVGPFNYTDGDVEGDILCALIITGIPENDTITITLQ